MTPLSVCVVGPAPPIKGGISQHTAGMASGLREAGHPVSVVSWRSQYPRFLYKGSQADVTGSEAGGAHHLLRWWSPLSWWKAGRRARRFDVLVVQWVTPFHAVPLRLVLAAAGRRVRLAVVHNPSPHERMPLAGPLTRMVLRRMDGALVHGEAVADELARIVEVPRVRVVGHPPNLQLTAAPLPTGPPIRLLFMGYVRHYKGPDIAIRAVQVLRDRGREVTLTIAGEFWEPVAEYAALAERHGVADQVDLRPGYVADDDMAELLASHALVVTPYRTATQSGIVPLAFAAGRPVVSTRVGGLAEVVTEGATGTLAEPGEVTGFADAVERAIDDLEGLAARARDVAVSWVDVAAAIVEMAGEATA